MNVLIIGKSGQLGEELVRQATRRKIKPIGFSHSELDITDIESVRKNITKIKPDVVINASAFHLVAECEKNPAEAFKVNSIAVRNVAEITYELAIPFVTYSTDYVFDGKKGSLYNEDDLLTPVQTYGISKTAGENMALAYNDRSIVIRSSGVYGGKNGSRSKKGNFALNILKEKDKKMLEVSSEQIVSPTYSRDLANATYDLLGKKNASGIYHLVNEGFCSWAEFTQEIMTCVGSSIKIIPTDRSGQSGGARRPLFSALKNNRAASVGVKLPTWENAIARYLSFLGYESN